MTSKVLSQIVYFLTGSLYLICYGIVHKAELQHAIYACRKLMHFQSHPGQNMVDFNNQGKNAPQCIAFWLEIFLFKIEIACGKKLKRRVTTSLKWQQKNTRVSSPRSVFRASSNLIMWQKQSPCTAFRY